MRCWARPVRSRSLGHDLGMTAPVTTRSARAEAVLRALETVRDPELDEPITSLGFVASCAVSAAGDAQVRLRLPTYFCAPNFAYLMVADAYDAVAALPAPRRNRRSPPAWGRSRPRCL